MAIVLPNGNFENPSLEYLRNYIKQNSNILAVINLPQETFIPFGTGVKTSLLFLQKEIPTKDYPIFFGRIEKLGYQGNKNGTPLYKKDEYGKILKDTLGSPLLDEDFSEMVEAYKEFQKENLSEIENQNHFSINYQELNGRFDFDFYSPENRNLLKELKEGKNVRLGDICDIVKLKSKKLKDQNKTVEYVELSDINTHLYEIINSTTYQVYDLPSRASYEIKEGDIITAIAGNSLGTKKHATALVNKGFEGCICTNGFRVLRNFKIDKYYLLHFLKSDFFLKQVFMYRTGAAIPNISDTDLSKILIKLPSEEIIDEISSKIKKAFQLQEEAKKQIQSINFV